MHLPLRVLFSFRSRYYYTIGLGSYLGLEANGSQLLTPDPRRNTLEHPESSFSRIPTGLSPSLARHSRQFRINELRCRGVYNTTSPPDFSGGFSLPYAFRSPLLTASRLISFPQGTKMLQFPRFPILTDCSEEQEVPFGNHRIKSSLRLPGAFRSLARPSSAPEPSHSPSGLTSR